MQIVVLDTETGGIPHEATALTAIGAVALRLEGGKLLPLEGHEKIAEFEVLIRPEPHLLLSDEALKIQGVSRADVMDATCRVSEAQALCRLRGWLDEVGFISGDWPMWAHNAEFDRNHLGAAIRRMSPRPPREFTAICGRASTWACTRYEAQNAVALRCMERPRGNQHEGGDVPAGFSLNACCLHFGIPLDSRASGHGALADAKLCARLLPKLAAVGGRI